MNCGFDSITGLGRQKVTVQFFIKGLDPAGLYPQSKGEPEINQLSQRLQPEFSGLELEFRCFQITSVFRHLAKANENLRRT